MDKIVLFNRLVYLSKRNNWMLDPRYFLNHNDVSIQKPIFLLGNQGGGLTLISRILRRNRNVVSVTGNSTYWSGADEMQNVFGPVLPKELNGVKYKVPKHDYLTPPRSWSYASDELIEHYRATEKKYSIEIEKKIKHIIKYLIYRYGKTSIPRFIDKSQVFTVKLGLLNTIFKNNNPKFILITRNPLIECPRAAMGRAGDMKRYSKFLKWQERLSLATQHWKNSIYAILEDIDDIGIDVLIIKFEDAVADINITMEKICDHCELDFNIDMLPSEKHKIPLGSMYRDRWFPIKTDINSKYDDLFDTESIEFVHKNCEELMSVLGYNN